MAKESIGQLKQQLSECTEKLDQANRRVTGLEGDLSDCRRELDECRADEPPPAPPPPPPPDSSIKPSLVPAWNGAVLLEDGFEGSNPDFRKWSMAAEPGNPEWTGIGDGGAVLGGDIGIIPDPTGKRGGNVFKSGIDTSRDPQSYYKGWANPNKSHLHNWWVMMGRGAIVDGLLRSATGPVLRTWCASAWIYVPADFPIDVAAPMIMQIKSEGTHHPLGFRMGRDRHLMASTRMPGGGYRRLEDSPVKVPMAEWVNFAYRVVLDKVQGRITFAMGGDVVFDLKDIMTTEAVGAYFGVGNYVSVPAGEPYPKCHYLVDDVRLTLEA